MPELYRRRLIPDECVHLKGDKVLLQNESMLLTYWNTLRPKTEFSSGLSLYLFDKGWKISKFYDSDNNFAYWYCDIIRTDYTKETDSYVFTDLLADVIIRQDGSVHVVDLDEFEPAFRAGLISSEEILHALNRLNELLEVIYSGRFSEYSAIINENEKECAL